MTGVVAHAPHADTTAGTSTGTVVITGLGVMAPNAVGTEEYWAATLAGTNGIAPVSRFDTSRYSAHLAGEVNLDVRGKLPGRILPQTDRMTRLALIAAQEAFADAGVDPATLPHFAAGVVTAASGGGFEFGHKELAALWSKGPAHVSAYQSFAWFYPVNTGQVSIRHGLHGPGSAIVSEQAGGLDAVSKACRHLRTGTSLMVGGAVDGSFSPWAWLCLTRSGRLSPATDPATAFLPFDRRANGSIPGEGGALLILESAADAADRGATPYAAVAGYGTTFDPRPGSGRPPGLRRAIELALADAGVTAGAVDAVFADAAGVPDLDAQEAAALAAVFGPGGVPVAVPKTMTGRLQAGGGALDLATAALALRDQLLPPAINLVDPAFTDTLDLVLDTPRRTALSTVLVVARGYGGFNSAMILRRA